MLETDFTSSSAVLKSDKRQPCPIKYRQWLTCSNVADASNPIIAHYPIPLYVLSNCLYDIDLMLMGSCYAKVFICSVYNRRPLLEVAPNNNRLVDGIYLCLSFCYFLMTILSSVPCARNVQELSQ